MKNVDSNKVEMSDGQDILMDKIGEKIAEVYGIVIDQRNRYDEHPKGYKASIDSKQMHSHLKNIEMHLDKLIEYRKEFMNANEKNPKILADIEKKIQDIDKA